MTTNRFPGVGYNLKGRDYNFYQQAAITATTFGGNSDGYQQPDMIVGFANNGIIFTNETSGQIIEVSFNGNTVHAQLDGTATSTTRTLTFLNRQVSMIWFRVKSGSSGTINVTVTAW